MGSTALAAWASSSSICCSMGIQGPSIQGPAQSGAWAAAPGRLAWATAPSIQSLRRSNSQMARVQRPASTAKDSQMSFFMTAPEKRQHRGVETPEKPDLTG